MFMRVNWKCAHQVRPPLRRGLDVGRTTNALRQSLEGAFLKQGTSTRRDALLQFFRPVVHDHDLSTPGRGAVSGRRHAEQKASIRHHRKPAQRTGRVLEQLDGLQRIEGGAGRNRHGHNGGGIADAGRTLE